MELDAAGAVHQVEEGGAAVPAAGGQPAGDAVGRLGLLPGLERVLVSLADVRDRHDPVEVVRERIDALGAQALELRPAVVLATALGHGAG